MGKSPIFLSVEAQDIYGISCDVYQPGSPGNVQRDQVRVNIKSIYKNQTNPPTTQFADVLLSEQRVTFYRYDGNPNVPEPFMIPLENNLVPNGGELDLEIIVIRASAKLQSPLKELAFGGGEGEIYLSALVEFFGEDLMGNAASGSITIPIWARDFF
jgi:hypothetical protein